MKFALLFETFISVLDKQTTVTDDLWLHEVCGGRNVVIGIATPVGAKFSAPIQTGPGAHAVSCSVGRPAGSLFRE
jgi:hypothetical protein